MVRPGSQSVRLSRTPAALGAGALFECDFSNAPGLLVLGAQKTFKVNFKKLIYLEPLRPHGRWGDAYEALSTANSLRLS